MPDISLVKLDERDLGGDATFFDTNVYVPAANKTILLIASGVGSVPPPEPIIPVLSTANGITWSLVASRKFDWAHTNRGIVSLFRGIGSSPVSGTTRVSYNRTFFRQALSVWECSNTDIGNLGANAIAAADSQKVASGAGLNPSITMPPQSDPANSTIGIIAYDENNPAIVAGVGFTLLLNLINAEGGGHALEMSQTVKENVDWNIGTDPVLGMIAVELVNATPAPPAAGPQILGRPAFITGNLIT